MSVPSASAQEKPVSTKETHVGDSGGISSRKARTRRLLGPSLPGDPAAASHPGKGSVPDARSPRRWQVFPVNYAMLTPHTCGQRLAGEKTWTRCHPQGQEWGLLQHRSLSVSLCPTMCGQEGSELMRGQHSYSAVPGPQRAPLARAMAVEITGLWPGEWTATVV